MAVVADDGKAWQSKAVGHSIQKTVYFELHRKALKLNYFRQKLIDFITSLRWTRRRSLIVDKLIAAQDGTIKFGKPVGTKLGSR